MKRVLLALGLCWGICVFAQSGSSDTITINQHPVKQSKKFVNKGQNELSLLFVINAKRGVISADQLELENVANAVVYFSDRPERIAGHIALESFLKSWNKSADSFAADPPNAVLSITEDGKTFNTVVVVLKNPTFKGEKLTFQIKIIEGVVPANGTLSFTNDPLFIDGGFPCFIAGC
jgi:hypothetical protein